MRKKKSIKVISVVLTMLILLGVLPMSALAANINISDMSDAVIQRPTNDTPDIVAEVKEKRDEFSKTYLLEDGSYYSIMTYAPIHEEVNGKWETIDDSLDDLSGDVKNIESDLQQASVESMQNSNMELMSNIPSESINSSLIINKMNCILDGNNIVFNGRATIAAKPEYLYYYLNNNKLVEKASLNVNGVAGSSLSGTTISLYESTVVWDENTEDLTLNTAVSTLIDVESVNANNSTFSWDITDLYNRWDRGETENKGFFLNSDKNSCRLNISSMYISIKYKNVDEYDLDSTYHTVDMGRAGKVYVNDITNTVKVEQDILNVNLSVFPISLKRIYNLTKRSENASAGKGFRWNYESEISFDGDLLAWYMFDGTVRCYVKTNEIVGEYQKFIETGKIAQLDTDNIVFWVKTSQLSTDSYNYSNFYAQNEDEKYVFDSNGNLIRIEMLQTQNTEINFNYSNGSLSSVLFRENTITYGLSIIEGTNSSIVTFAGTGGITSECVSVSTQTNVDGSSTSTVTYPDNESVTYKFNANNELVEIVDVDGSKLKLYYLNDEPEIGSRLLKYEKIVNVNLVDELIESIEFNIPTTYQREFINEKEEKEFIQLDCNFNIVAHRDFSGEYLFADYDDNNIINSYVVGDEIGEEILINPGFEEDDNGYIAAWDSDISESVNKESIQSQQNGQYVLEISYDKGFSESVYQILDDISVDRTYIFGGWVYVEKALPNNNSLLTLDIINLNNYEVISSIEFDTISLNQWQYRMTAFKLYENVPIAISLNYQGVAASTIYADNLTLYESELSKSDITSVTTDNPGQILRNDDGTINCEIFTDGITSLVTSYEYDGGRVSEIKDVNGLISYYNYNDKGMIEKIGTIKTGDTIIDPVTFQYNTKNLCSNINQIINSISTGEMVNISTGYEYDRKNRIDSVAHNGFFYDFVYDAYGNLISVDLASEDYEKPFSEPVAIEYEYEDIGVVGEINYSNGLKVVYTYTDDEINSVQYRDSQGNSIKTINYSKNNEGYLVVEDTKTNYKIVHTQNGYNLYNKLTDNTEILLYVLEKNIDGSSTETYMPNLYTDGTTALSVVTTSASTTLNNENTGNATSSSTVSFNKVKSWNSSKNYETVNYTFERQSVKDYFGRIQSKTIGTATPNSDGETSEMTEAYSYKELENGITSTLVSSYSTNINVVNSNNETTQAYSNEIFYEYDHNGNIIFEYEKDNNIPSLKKYYEYDEAQQIVGEINFDKCISMTYTYDQGGNITSKTSHNFNEASANITNIFNSYYTSQNNSYAVPKGITKFGTTLSIIQYGYDSIWTDRMVSYNGNSISYDALGNPNNYIANSVELCSVGANSESNQTSISATMEWTGNRLTAVETSEDRFEYEYDENGYRTRKLTYSKELNDNNEYVYDLENEILYVWDNGVLKSIVNSINTSKPIQSDIIYDEEGNMAGFVSMTGTAFYYVKDSNGSVNALISEDGTLIANISYDAWGNPRYTINADKSTTSGMIEYAIYGALIALNPSTYNGYLYDFETGLYFFKDRVYSPCWGRYLNMNEFSSLLEKTNTALSANLYLFCNNNPVNGMEPYTKWLNNGYDLDMNVEGFKTGMSKTFLSRTSCMIFSNQIMKAYGVYDSKLGYTYKGMNAIDISSALFAKTVGKYAMSSINKVNACWGDGWIVNNRNANTITVIQNDPNAWKYEKIWYAASDIKMYAYTQGVYISI